MTSKPERAANGGSDRYAAESSAAARAVDTFVINLCSSTTPMALVNPQASELRRFQFFVSRRLEDGRERFRLHMGHFQTLEEAEDWLSVVRDIYPGAWAGEAPGKRLRAKSQSTPAPVPANSKTAPSEQSVNSLPLQPASLAHEPAAAQQRSPAVALPQEMPAAAPLDIKAPPAPAEAGPPHAAAPISARPPLRAPLSNVREVLAALDETDAQDGRPMLAANAPQARRELSDTEVMQVLEARRSEEPARGAADVPGGIAMLLPDDSGTRRALRAAVRDETAVSFAVQLQWSAQPLPLEKVPPLAIFGAYTLYTVEGCREGRKWYGLRLGFFGDATAAKQVAHYVRSEFAAVAVVPVSPEERGRAGAADQQSCAAALTERAHAIEPPEIELLNEVTPTEPRPALLRADPAKSGSAAARSAAIRSKTQRSREWTPSTNGAHSLEETLEILGAGSLELDNGRGERLNHSRVRHLKVELRKDSPFQRLLARLTERVHKS